MCSLSSYPGIAGQRGRRERRSISGKFSHGCAVSPQSNADDNLCSWVAVGSGQWMLLFVSVSIRSLMRRQVVAVVAEGVLDVGSGVVGFVR
jgi:hypothetical protein